MRVAGVAVMGAIVILAGAQTPQAGRGPAISPETQRAIQLDLHGQEAQARVLFQQEIDHAANPQTRAAAERDLAMSWAFSGNCSQTVAAEQKVIAYWKTRETVEPANAFYQEGEMADEAARVCIDLGDLDPAATMYKLGRDRGLQEPHIAAGRKDLWEYRYQHALARLAARRGERAEAQRHVTAAQTILNDLQVKDPKLYQQQIGFYPYLVGYVAYYAGDAKTALAEFQKDTRHDPFIACMIGLSYEKLGEKGQARKAYQQASQASAHNPPAAFARPFAQRKMAALGGS